MNYVYFIMHEQQQKKVYDQSVIPCIDLNINNLERFWGSNRNKQNFEWFISFTITMIGVKMCFKKDTSRVLVYMFYVSNKILL